ncbi:2-amino-4-hydroxy-6-hydroxymethyldihydropteridine diphosphokinase [Tranquillimonas rosea]|uniref:2-amino-4-hydroxy-6- hydroxymethyldihydropteridine diphosphokinase n=1 Tax=Tranquillimonas rosea TaxID=641238 RepID=UPI000A7BDC4C|nr:2-amino-4-hydroxy-6-hydroxymethyldihydropteridine diphosphokinase [Tranquillimonas rosea]
MVAQVSFRVSDCPEILVALGANLPRADETPSATIRAAVESLADEDFRLVAASPLYRTPCFPPGAGPDYVNAAAVFCGPDAASEVLSRLHRVESAFSRERVERWGSRTLDLDLLAVGERVCPDAVTVRQWIDLPLAEQTRATPEQLILPHPRLQERGFVLVPLADVAPDWRHPLLDVTVREMCEALPEEARAGITRL